MKVKVLLATNMGDLDDAIASESGIEVAYEPIQRREDVVQAAEQTNPEVVILASQLEGNMDIIDIVYQLRTLDMRVVFIAGDLSPEDLTVKRLTELGVDVITGEIRIGQVLEKTLYPNQQKHINYIEPDIGETEDTANNEEKENPFSKIAKIRKSMPTLSMPQMMPKMAKKATKVLERVVAVCSPAPTGKTFVAVNLATVAAQEGYSVALVDADYKKFGVHTWLNCPIGEDGLIKALHSTSDPVTHAYQPGYLPGLYVFTYDPGEDKTPLINDKSLMLLLETLQELVDLIILDVPGSFSAPITKAVMNSAGIVLIINDIDFSHLLDIQREVDGLQDNFDFEKCIVVANQIIDSEKLPADDAERATGMKVSCVIPSRLRSVMESIKVGIPAVMFDHELRKPLEDLLAGFQWGNQEILL